MRRIEDLRFECEGPCFWKVRIWVVCMLSRFRMELKAFSTDPFATFWSPHCLWLHLLLQDRCLTGPAKEQFAHHFLQEDRFGPEEIVRKVAELNGDDGQHGPICNILVPALPLVAFAVARPVFDWPCKRTVCTPLFARRPVWTGRDRTKSGGVEWRRRSAFRSILRVRLKMRIFWGERLQ